MRSESDIKYSRGGFWAFLAIVVATYAQVFIHLRGPWLTWGNAGFVALGGLYLWLGTGKPFWSRQRESLAGTLCYLGGQMMLGTLILFASPVPGMVGLIVLPVVSQSVFMLPRIFAGLFSATLFVVTLAHLAAPYGWRVAFNSSLSFLAAFVFTLAFSYIAQREAAERKQAQALSAQLEEANRRLREAAAQAEELAVVNERNRLAREIHDGLGHYLTTIAVQLEAARALLAADPPRAAAAIEKARQQAQDALGDVRRSVSALRADAPREALSRQLERLAADQPEILVASTVLGAARGLPPAVEHALFRVAQEGLTNARKHSGAVRAQIVLDFRDSARVRLEVADEGRGPPAGAAAEGFGLNGVRERVEQFGGRMQAAARPEGGFALRVEVPG